MATACKLEMSLDEIIKANKSKAIRAGPNGPNSQMGKKRPIRGGVTKGKPFGRGRAIGQNSFKARAAVAPQTTKIVPGRRLRLNSVQQRKSKAIRTGPNGPNSQIGKKRPILGGVTKGKPFGRGRAIGQNPFKLCAAIVPQTTKIVPGRRLRLNSVQQNQPFVLIQQQSPQRVPPSFSSMSIRQHINAMRRANTVQQLQTQLLKPQFMPAPIVIQQRTIPRRMLRQSPPQYVIVQQPSRGQRSQFRAKPLQSFRRQQQSQVILNPMYEPPNFLQRIPMGSAASFIQY